jgi:hypothetical protein
VGQGKMIKKISGRTPNSYFYFGGIPDTIYNEKKTLAHGLYFNSDRMKKNRNETAKHDC